MTANSPAAKPEDVTPVGGGAIVKNSSAAAHMGVPTRAAYGAGKARTRTATRTAELGVDCPRPRREH
jgi:NAD(P)-dependent dehydrogenase (short-subunit alcohol dehydrogenase family)